MKKPESELSIRGEPPESRDREPSPSTSTNKEDSSEDKGEDPELFEVVSNGDVESPIIASEEDEPRAQLGLNVQLDLDPDNEDTVATEGISRTIGDLQAENMNSESDLVDYLTCPQCRAEHKITGPNGVDGFLTDYVAESHLKEQDVNSSVSAKSSLKCDGCENSEPVVAFCDTCFEYLCDFCSVAHKRLKRFTEHSTKDVGDIDLNETSKEARLGTLDLTVHNLVCYFPYNSCLWGLLC